MSSLRNIFAIVPAIIPRRICLGMYVMPAGLLPSESPKTSCLTVLETKDADHLRILSEPQDAHLALMADVAFGRFARGDKLWLFEQTGKVVHIAWTRHDAWLDLSYELGEGAIWSLQDNNVIIYDCYTPVAARGSGYYQRALTWLAERWQDCLRWIYVREENLASKRGIERCGFHSAAVICRWRSGKLSMSSLIVRGSPFFLENAFERPRKNVR